MKDTLNIAQESADKGEQIVSMLEQFGLFWNVNKVNLLTPDAEETAFYGTQREDSRKVFACVKNGYQVLQNWELAEMITDVAGKFDMGVARGGLFNGGAKVYLQVDTGTLKGIGENNDTVKRYISALNSHDGSSSLSFGMTNETVSCANTFHRVHASIANKIRHTMSMKEKVDALIQEFTQVKEAEKSLYEKFFALASREATAEDIKQVVAMTTAVDLNVRENDAKEMYSKNQVNKAKQLTTRISEEMAVKGQTLWGLFSGVTKYSNRDMSTPNRENATLESKFLGSAGKMDNKVFDFLTADMVTK